MISEFPSMSKFYDVTTGSPDVVDGHHGMPHFVPYESAIGLGKVSGHTPFRGMGRRTGLSTATNGDDIWEGVATSFGGWPE